MSFDRASLAAAVADHGTVARILVLRSAGSAPRDGGTSMLVWADGMSGTIGGGTLEWQADYFFNIKFCDNNFLIYSDCC